MIYSVIKEMRIKQYTKNLLVFAAALFSGTILDKTVLFLTFCAFLSFSFVASAVYIFNDIMDRNKDRQHPEKCKRPIASGKISISFGIFLVIILVIAATYISLLLNKSLFAILIIYVLMNLAYSLILKHIVIVDVMIIAFGFVLRALAGATVIDVDITSWFILCVFMLSLFLALAKRRAEMQMFIHNSEKQRKVLDEYTIQLIDALLLVVTAMTLTSYSLFAIQSTKPNEVFLSNLSYMICTIPIVIYGIFRYMYLIYKKGEGGSPDEILLHDKHILGTVIVYVMYIMITRIF